MGAGKELAARTLHTMSRGVDGPFVILSAATMAPERMEEELFGIEDVGGGMHRVGALEEAHGGTLYIDEVADMPLETQGKVLRVLVEQTFQRVGGAKKVKVDVRIVSSTSRDLATLIAAGTLPRGSLSSLERRSGSSTGALGTPRGYSRADRIFQPRLLAFIRTAAAKACRGRDRRASDQRLARQCSPASQQCRTDHDPRRRRAGERDHRCDASRRRRQRRPADPVNGFGGEHLLALPLRDAREAFERDYLAAQLSRFGGNISRTANFVGMERSALHRKIKLLGLSSRGEPEELPAAATG